MITAVDHFTINITDVEASLRFYGQTLGFEQLDTVEMEGQTMYYFSLPGESRLELIFYHCDTGKCGDGPTAKGKFRHLAFKTDDLSSTRDTLEKAGVEIIAGPEFLKELNVNYMLAIDPNGCELEFTAI